MAGPSKLNENKINTRLPVITDLFFFANPNTGFGGQNTLQALKDLIVGNPEAPVKSYADIPSLLANTTIPILYFAYVADATDDVNVGTGWALYLFLGGDRDDLSNYLLCLPTVTSVEAVSGPGTLTLNMGSARERIFTTPVIVNEAKVWTVIEDNGLLITDFFETNGAHTQTLPVNFLIQQFQASASGANIWDCPGAGKYKLIAHKNVDTWYAELYGPY